MIETLSSILPIIIYLLLIALLVVVIVLGIKIIISIDKINAIITDVHEKVQALNSVFKLATNVSDKLSSLSSRIFETAFSAINKVLGINNGKDEDDYE